jgi:hypothetical protein
MRQYLQIVIASSIFLAAAISHSCDREQPATQSELVIAAVVEKIGKDPGVSSGYYLIYQLAKYRVVEVCAGNYSQKEIVVDHLLVSGDELKALRVGDKVYLTLQPSKTIKMRFNEEGFRDSSQNVGTFYIGHKPDVTKPAPCKYVN